ncbi:hypothetical protein CANARDRAFT_8153 [[Candida] arabinofermentans NRRL YB-2248]|uniref:Uncharacterized protein n=1 Tax=[Candida] arabinofermentans NRRL YB-2248 TaxID=983967 RepID=A0A1E4SZU5_9ASCO|nr:hypothetical protein CANARDRAFT_8153 [[Candida] arabinofermentans NRRL YB-2248]
MAPDKLSHCHVKGGDYSSSRNIIAKTFAEHNFINQLDIILSKDSLTTAGLQNLITATASVSYMVSCDLYTIIKSALQLSQQSDVDSIHLTTIGHDVDHQDTVSITKGVLNLKMSQETFLKSGLDCKLSSISKGNKNLRNKMYKISFDLVKFKAQTLDKNYMRLIWFIENTYRSQNFKFIFNSSRPFIDSLDNDVNEALQEIPIKTSTTSLGNIKVPSLEIKNDQLWLSETLEWLSYSSIEGPQLSIFDKTESYISSYSELLESDSNEEIIKVTITGGLIPSSLSLDYLQSLSSIEWFGILQHGARDSNVSYGVHNEHCYVNGGENIDVLLKSEDKFVLWEILAPGDAHR